MPNRREDNSAHVRAASRAYAPRRDFDWKAAMLLILAGLIAVAGIVAILTHFARADRLANGAEILTNVTCRDIDSGSIP